MNKKNVKRLITVLFCLVTLISVTCVYASAVGGLVGAYDVVSAIQPIKEVSVKFNTYSTSFEGINNILYDDTTAENNTTKQGASLVPSMSLDNAQIPEEMLYVFNNLTSYDNAFISSNSSTWSCLDVSGLSNLPTTQINWNAQGVASNDSFTFVYSPFVYVHDKSFKPIYGSNDTYRVQSVDYNKFNYYTKNMNSFIKPVDANADNTIYMAVTYYAEYSWIDENKELKDNYVHNSTVYVGLAPFNVPGGSAITSQEITSIPPALASYDSDILFSMLRVELNHNTYYYKDVNGNFKTLATDLNGRHVYNIRATQKFLPRDVTSQMIDLFLNDVDSGVFIPDDYSVDMSSWLSTSIGAFMNAELFPGFSFGGMLGIAVAVPLATIFLKKFAGG